MTTLKRVWARPTSYWSEIPPRPRSELALTLSWPPQIAGYLWAQSETVQQVPFFFRYTDEWAQVRIDVTGYFLRVGAGWRLRVQQPLRGPHLIVTAPILPARTATCGLGLDSADEIGVPVG